jgi:hypothetical protein
MLRAAALSLLVLVSVVVMLPTGDSSAHHNGRSSVSRSRRSHMNRRHSRAWWRRYRARMRRKRAALRRRQALQRTRSKTNLNVMADSHKKSAAAPAKISTVSSFKDQSAWNFALPHGWSRRAAAANGGMKFIVNAPDGRYVGEATLSVVNNGRASGEPVLTARTRKAIGGVPFTELRRTVIDKMIASNGWVVNDLQREVGGHPVFIVLAQTPASSDGRASQQSWVFYFTEVEGRIYSLATNSPLEFADRMANEAAQLMASFKVNSRSTPLETSQR